MVIIKGKESRGFLQFYKGITKPRKGYFFDCRVCNQRDWLTMNADIV